MILTLVDLNIIKFKFINEVFYIIIYIQNKVITLNLISNKSISTIASVLPTVINRTHMHVSIQK